MSEEEQPRLDHMIGAFVLTIIGSLFVILQFHDWSDILSWPVWVGPMAAISPNPIWVTVVVMSAVSVFLIVLGSLLEASFPQLSDALDETVSLMAPRSRAGLVGVALITAVSEELLFRGALIPWLGPLVTSILFGLCHAGSGRGAWALWAGIAGYAYAIMTLASSSILPAILCHFTSNLYGLLRVQARLARREDGKKGAENAGGTP